MKDVIYRQDAIDSVQRIGRLATLTDNDAVIRMSAVEYVLYNLPSAQPDVLDTNVGDIISRQAAIDECNKRGAEHIGYAIAHLPSAQPEPCEDAVSRKDAIIQLSHNKNGDPDCDVIIQHDIETLKQLSPVTPKRKVSISEIRNQVAGEPVDLFTELTDEEKKQNKWYVQGYTDAMKRKTGRWAIKKGVLHPLEIDGICSKCGYTTGFYTLFKFCPNCGAKMNGDERNEIHSDI